MKNERFWSKIDKVSSPRGCWLWTATKNNKGYGLFRPGGSAPKRLAHRISYEMHCEPIPDGLIVMHACDNPACVNPEHLSLGSKKGNMQDCKAKGRVSRHKPPLGHRPPRMVGSAHARAKMTEDQVRQYRSELAAGKPLRQLARETGINRRTLMHMRDGKNWSHVV
jgi:hypothetical protein